MKTIKTINGTNGKSVKTIKKARNTIGKLDKKHEAMMKTMEKGEINENLGTTDENHGGMH